MDRLQILKYLHRKVIWENDPANADEDDAAYGCDSVENLQTVAGPFTQDTWWEGNVELEMLGPGYEVASNLTLLKETAPEDIPLEVVWGIGGWWQWEVTIPMDAKSFADCKCIGSSGE